MKRKLASTILSVCMLMSVLPATSISFAATNDTIEGNPVAISDSVTGCTYNYINFNGKDLYRTYMGKQSWTMDGKSFLCGVKGSTTATTGTIYLYNTETNKFTEVGTGNIATEVAAVIGTDNCVYYVSGKAIKKYNIDTKETTIVLPGNFNYEPDFISITNDCKYIAFRSPETDYAWCEDGETGIYRYNIAEKKVECYGYKFDVSGYSDSDKVKSHILNHHQINPEDPDIVFFAHDTNDDPHYIYDREWTVDFATGEIKNIFKQGKQDTGASTVFTSHESWGASGKYLYMNGYGNSATDGKGASIIRCYKDGSHREFIKNTHTGEFAKDTGSTYGVGHASPSGDDKFTVVDMGNSKYVYVLSNDTYETFPIYYSATGANDENGKDKGHPYHAHPNVARNHYRTDWGMVHDGVLGVGWYDFTNLTEKVAKGGRYPVNEYIDRVSYSGLDCESETTSYDEYDDVIHAKAGNYIYFDINEGIVDGVNESITLSFDYYDNGTYSDKPIKIIYTNGDDTDNDLADSEDATVEISRKASKDWITYKLEIKSGNFENINPYRTDFKIGGDTDTYIKDLKITSAPAVSDGYAGGDGTKENPYQISNAAELRYFSNQVSKTADKEKVDSNISYTATKASDSSTATYAPERYHVFSDKYFELTADIDLCNQPFTPIGTLVNNFNGHFNGNGYKISNVYIDGTTPAAFERYAFFGATGADVEIKNLGLENLTCNFKGSNNKYSVTINNENYTYEDRLTGAAGFVSTYAGGTFKNCYLKNAEVRDFTEQMSSGGTGAFFGLGYGTVEATESNGYNQMTVTNCYVNGATLRAHSSLHAFIGPNMTPNTVGEIQSAGHSYRVTKTVTNCYTANISRGYYNDNSLGTSSAQKSYDGVMYPFASSTNYTTYNNCYTTSVGEMTSASTDGTTWTYTKAEVSDKVLQTTDVDTLKRGLIDNTNYSDDENNTNGGYPVLMEEQEPEGWDGVSDKRPEGDGETEETAFLISTKEELLWFKNSVNTVSDDGVSNGYESCANSYFKLVNDIDFEGYEWEPVGNSKGTFNGHFDGNGHVIKNFTISSYYNINTVNVFMSASATSTTSLCTDKLYMHNGFFGRTGKDSVVKNLGIENAKINFWNHDYYYNIKINDSGVLTSYDRYSSQYNGAMVGYAAGKFINCYVKNSEIKNMWRPSSDGNVAGFVGYATNTSSFEGCYVKDTKLAASVYTSICGFVGKAIEGSTFTDCYAAGVVENKDLVSNRANETTRYGFGYNESGLNETNSINATNCISELADYQAVKIADTIYTPATYYNTRSIGDNGKTKENIIDAVATYENLAPDNSGEFGENVNDGYPICFWQMTSKAKQSYDAASFDITDAIMADLPLNIGKFGSLVTWTTSDSTIVDTNGSVTFYPGEKTVTLMATTEDGYTTKSFTVTVEGKVPFENYSFNVTSDGVDYSEFVSGGTLNKISFYKNRTDSDCYMYTILYDKEDGNRMKACSIDFIDDSEMSAKSTHTINLSNPITLSGDTSRYILKVLFITDNTKFTPLCDNFEY